MIIEFTDEEIDALQDSIEFYVNQLGSVLAVQTNPKLAGIIKNLESAGLKLGMEEG